MAVRSDSPVFGKIDPDALYEILFYNRAGGWRVIDGDYPHRLVHKRIAVYRDKHPGEPTDYQVRKVV